MTVKYDKNKCGVLAVDKCANDVNSYHILMQSVICYWIVAGEYGICVFCMMKKNGGNGDAIYTWIFVNVLQ